MKITTILMILLIFSLTACGGSKQKVIESAGTTNVQSTTSDASSTVIIDELPTADLETDLDLGLDDFEI